ncbi:MAG: O-antigen ligase family protein, partial [Cyclobacteriaceae bacterium]|nr:O-antigen ligase family protein [Cyclobacteriaceae bacterium]
VGVGDVQNKLQEVYKRYFLKYSYMEKFNAHNEYVQTLLGLGFVGLIILLFTLAFPFYLAYKKQEIIYILFIALFAYCCITESMLHVQKGIVFYAFFNSLFLSQLMNGATGERI